MPPLISPNTPSPPGGSTPFPAAGLGRLVTPASAQFGNPALTLVRPSVFQTGRMGSLGIAPPEKNGDGALFPALIVAVGQTGRRVIEHLKLVIRDRCSHPDLVPNVRFLYVDTDPTAAPTLVPDDPAALAPREVVIARLNRPAHYLQRDRSRRSISGCRRGASIALPARRVPRTGSARSAGWPSSTTTA